MSDRPITLAVSPDLLSTPGSFLRETGHSMLYSWQVMTQAAVDCLDRGAILPKLELCKAPADAPTGSADWAAHQLGSAVAIAVPFYVMHKGVNAGAERIFGKVAEGSVARELGVVGTTGFLFGSLLTPQLDTDKRDFFQARLESGATLGLSVAAMTYAGLKVQGAGKVLSPQHPILGCVLKSDFVAGALSGIPGGLVYAELNALTTHRRLLPTGQELGDSVTNFTMVGGLLGLPGSFKGLKSAIGNARLPKAAP